MANTKNKKEKVIMSKKGTAPIVEKTLEVVKKEKEAPKKIVAKAETVKLATAKAPEKIAAKPEAKKIAAKPEAKKIAAKPEAKKIAAKPEAKKIVAKPEAKKIATKETVKLEVKDTKETAKKVVVKPATKKESLKKPPVKKEVAEKASKAPIKKEEKAAPKKTVAKKATKSDKVIAYEGMTLDECFDKLNAMNVHHVYEDYTKFLMDEDDLKVLEKNIIKGNGLEETVYTFEKDGYDKDLVMVTLQKVAETMDVKAADYKEMKKDMNACVKSAFGNDVEKNAKEYLKEFKLCEKILMLGQRKHVSTAKEVSTLIGSDVEAFVKHFFELAYAVLPTWQYDDVKFYEDFAFAVLSQYEDLYEEYQLRILIDIADLYIKHGDFQHGDVCYGYILRDNMIKDYIYYRFASVYEDIDFNKAKSLAYEALTCVDARFVYYQNIMDIINK